jgi:hypothetical protein
MTKAQIGQIREEVATLLTSRLAALPQETAVLQRAARALRQAESIEQWVQIVADAAAVFAPRVALFAVEGDRLAPKALRGPGELPAGEVVLSEAPALRQVIESKETVVCLAAASELGGALLQPALAKRVHLLPVTGKTRVLGILYAEGEANLAALETLTALAAGSLELRRVTVAMPLIQPAPAEPEHRHPVELVGTALELAVIEAAPALEAVPEPEAVPALEPVDWRARRGASVAVAKLLLQHAGKLAEGRARKNVYAALRVPIETVRLEFRDRFPGREAYLEAELDARLLAPAS